MCREYLIPCTDKWYEHRADKVAENDEVKGAGGVPWVQIMENEFECLIVRGGHGGHIAEKCVKKYCF